MILRLEELVMSEAAVDFLCWDMIDGGFLDSTRFTEARANEINWVESTDLFVPAHRSSKKHLT